MEFVKNYPKTKNVPKMKNGMAVHLRAKSLVVLLCPNSVPKFASQNVNVNRVIFDQKKAFVLRMNNARKTNLTVVQTKNYSKTLIGTFKCANALMTISEMILASVNLFLKSLKNVHMSMKNVTKENVNVKRDINATSMASVVLLATHAATHATTNIQQIILQISISHHRTTMIKTLLISIRKLKMMLI